MKLKFKATAKDWIIFIIFSIFLLYVVAIAVVNLNTIAVEGRFNGLNPLPAFTPKYLGATILFYILALVGIFLSVKSYFFEKEKGIGFSMGEKKSDGYSRWAKEKEVKDTLTEVHVKDKSYDAAGFPIVNDGVNMWVDNGESHNLVIGSTGTGKTQCIIHPLVKILAKKGESMIVTDPKGEIYRESAGLLKEKGYKIVILNFRDPQRGNCWNPLSLPYNLYHNGNTDKAMELLDDLAANILYEENSKDPFWSQTAADYFAGIALGLFEDAKPEEVNINSISLMAAVGDEKFGFKSNYMKEYFNSKNPASAAYTCASGTVYAPEETKGSIVSTFKQKIRLFASRENLSEMLAHSDFDMSMIGKEKTAVFMIIQDEKKTYHALATIFIKQCYETLIDVAQNSPKGELPVRTNFILDEFANMPPLKDITTMITAARSRLIRFTMIIQNFAQLDAVYGKENAQTIRSNCNNMLYLLTTELAALKEISELCGEIRVKVGKGDKQHEETRPLATISDLQKMKVFEAIVIRTRLYPFKTKLVPNFKMDWGIKSGGADEFVQREKQPIAVFDLKAYVEKNNENKFGNPAMPTGNSMFGPNPFANQQFGNMANPFVNNINQSVNPNVPNKSVNPELLNQSVNPNMENRVNKPFDVDELIKRIDQKIVELEAEEKAKEDLEKQKLEENKSEVDSKEVINDNKEETVYEKSDLQTSIESDNTVNEGIQPVLDNSEDVTKLYQKTTPVKISDDQFFDDFFDE